MSFLIGTSNKETKDRSRRLKIYEVPAIVSMLNLENQANGGPNPSVGLLLISVSLLICSFNSNCIDCFMILSRKWERSLMYVTVATWVSDS